MSDLSENQNIQEGEDEFVPEIDDTNYFKEQDEKFEELHKKLQKLKEENKRQIDAIINSLDDLMASKCVIEQTLDKVVPDDLPIQISNEKLNVVDLLSKVTGIVNGSSSDSSRESESKGCASEDDSALQASKEEHNSQPSEKMDCTNDTPKEEETSQALDKVDCTDNTTEDSKTTEDSPVVGSKD